MTEREECRARLVALLDTSVATAVMIRVALETGEPEAVVDPLIDRFWNELRDGLARDPNEHAALYAIEMLLADRIAKGAIQMLGALYDLREGAA